MGIPFYHPSPHPPGAFGHAALPDAKAGVLSRLTFSWMTPLLKVGYSRPLHLDDLWMLDDKQKCKVLADRLDTEIRRLLNSEDDRRPAEESAAVETMSVCSCELCAEAIELKMATPPSVPTVDKPLGQPTVRRAKRGLIPLALYAAFRQSLWQTGMCQATAMALEVSSPLVTQALLRQITDAHQRAKEGQPQATPISATIGLAIALFVILQAHSLFSQNFHQSSMLLGVSMRSAIIDLICRKSMKLTVTDRKEYNSGKLTTLLSADASYLDWAAGSFFNVLLQPVQILVGMALLIHLLGYSALVGLGVLVASTPLQGWLFRVLIDARQAQLGVIDKRVSLTSELLSQIRGVKLLAWEKHFRKRILEFRAEELRHLKRGGWHRATLTSTMSFLPTQAATLTFVTYALTGHDLNAATIFAALHLYNILQTPLSMLPLAFQGLTDAYVAIGRIGSLLASREVSQLYSIDEAKELALSATGDFTFEKSDEAEEAEAPFKLQGVNLQVPRGSLVCIVGSVGSGKSALLRAILGEMCQTAGHITFGGNLGYVPQEACIVSGTIRSNILFGNTEDSDRLQWVIDTCCLRQDISMLPAGLDTQLGSKGVTLSGGQRQRISLARAAYHNSDIVLFDDPLSAVDSKVSAHILYNAVLSGPFSQRTRLIVTHQLAILPYADFVVVMKEDGCVGRIAQQGSYETLSRQAGLLCDMIKQVGGITSNSASSGPDLSFTAGKATSTGAISAVTSIKANLISEEERTLGSVSWRIYLHYASMMGRTVGAFGLLLLLIGSQICRVGSTVILGLWTERSTNGWGLGHYIGLYGGMLRFEAPVTDCLGFGFGQAFFTWAATLAMTFAGIQASYKAFDSALEAVTRSPIRWFDINPVGRILSRLSKDVEQLDDRLSYQWNLLLTNALSVVGVVGLVFYTFPYLGLLFIPLSVVYYLCGSFYQRTSREVKRIDAITRSHVYSSFEEQAKALDVILPFGQTSRYEYQLQQAVDTQCRAYIVTVTLQQWLGIRLDLFGNIVILGISLYGAVSRESVSPSQLGIVLTYALLTTSVVSTLVNLIAIVEQEMNCVERISEYGRLQPEGSLKCPQDPPKAWPYSGNVVFDNVKLRYGDSPDLALGGVSFEAYPGQKLAIVGTTGAGKSSIVSALLAAHPLSGGKIVVDNISINDIGLESLRSHVALIPQDNVMFAGTIRDNLDPEHKRPDAELWTSLQRVGLATSKGSARNEKFSLDAAVEEGGANFSVGERQLVSLARAFVKNSRLVIMDEATSAVDLPTEAIIQAVIQTELSHSTLLCVAHRLQTILYFDRILVMEHGQVVESGDPLELYDCPDSIFHDMCAQAIIDRARIISVQQAAAERREEARSFTRATLQALHKVWWTEAQHSVLQAGRPGRAHHWRSSQSVTQSVILEICRDSFGLY